MKSIFKILFFLLVSITAYSQTTTDTIPAWQYFTKADSLLTERKLDSVVVYFKKALPIYKKAKVWGQVARCYNKISESYRRNQKYRESLDNAKKALQVSARYLRKNNREKAFAYDNIGNLYVWWKSDHNSAMKNYMQALNIRKRILLKNHEDIAKSFANIGNIYLFKEEKEEYDKALSYYQNALEIRRAKLGPDHLETAIIYFNIGIVYYRREEYKKSLKYFNKSLSIEIKYSKLNRSELAKSYKVVGDVYQKTGRYNMALQHYKKQLKVLIKIFGKENPKNIVSLNKIGIIYKKIGNYDMALYHYNMANDIKNRNQEKFKKNYPIYNNIGVVYKYKGQYNKALNYFKKGLKLNLETLGENHHSVALNYNNIGNIYKLQGNYDKALNCYLKSLEIRTEIFDHNNSHIAESYSDIGELYNLKKQYDKALNYTNRAYSIRLGVFGRRHPDVAHSYINLGAIYRNMGDYLKTLRNYQKALEIRQNIFGDHHPKVASAYNNLANLFFAQNKFKKALNYYSKAITANTISNNNTNQHLDQNVLLSSIQGQSKTYKVLYKENKDVGNLNNAIAMYQKADTIINTIRQTFTNYADKVRFAQKAKEVYQGAIEAQLLLFTKQKDRQALKKAFYYSEKSKSNTLKELLAASNAKNFTGLPEDVVTLEKELRINHAYYQSKITESFASGEIDSSKVRDNENKLFDINNRQDSLTQVLEKNYPKYYELKHQNKIVSVSELQKNLNEQITILEFFTSDSITYAFTVSKHNVAVKELSTKDLTDQIEQLRAAITSKNTSNYKTIAHQFYTTLINPVKDQFVGDELIIIPDGPLWHLNFELLLTQNDASNNPKELSYLLKEYAVSYANSANLLFAKSKEKHQKEKRQECLAFSFSDSTQITDNDTMSMSTLRDTGDDLPGTRKEIRAISDIINGQYYYGSQAIEANFKKNANQYNILHLALHGDVDHERPENSKLYFTKSKDTLEDNLLYGHELFALDIPAELTVLSACNTGTGKIAKGEGIMSLGSAFQYAGTKSLLLSSWEVSDQTTPELMKYFYTHLKAGMNKSKALQQAKLQYLNTANINRTHPFYWGGFYLVGDAAPIQFDDYTYWYWMLGILIAMLVLGGLFWYWRKKVFGGTSTSSV